VLKERVRIHEGEIVKLSLNAAAANFFDPVSGDRLESID
jgi:hypothetical protein